MIKPGIGGPVVDGGEPINSGLKGCWLMEAGSGGTLYDIGPLRKDATMTNMDPNTDWVGSPYGYSVDFDGTNDYAEATSFPAVYPATLHILFRVHNTSQWYVPFSHSASGTNGGNSGWRIETRQDNNKLSVVFGGVALYDFNFTMTANQWLNAIVTLPGDGLTSTLYIIPEGGSRSILTTTLGNISGTPDRIAFGIRGDASDYLNGRVAYARLWDRILSQDEAMLLHAFPFHGIHDADDDFVYKAAAAGGSDPAAAGFRMLLGVGR